MPRKKNINREMLTDNITYQIEDTTIYLLLGSNTITNDELNIMYKKLPLLLEDNDLSYINVSCKHLEENKEFFIDLGFTLSYYDVNKLNELYKGIKNKKEYRCYGLMTKKDFVNKTKEEKKEGSIKEVKVINSNSGFVSSMLLLFGGIALLCYFCVHGAISLVK